jgi:hypothetical protein
MLYNSSGIMVVETYVPGLISVPYGVNHLFSKLLLYCTFKFAPPSGTFTSSMSLQGEEVLLVGEFKGGWNEPIKAVHASGPKYTVDLRLPQGK